MHIPPRRSQSFQGWLVSVSGPVNYEGYYQGWKQTSIHLWYQGETSHQIAKKKSRQNRNHHKTNKKQKQNITPLNTLPRHAHRFKPTLNFKPKQSDYPLVPDGFWDRLFLALAVKDDPILNHSFEFVSARPTSQRKLIIHHRARPSKRAVVNASTTQRDGFRGTISDPLPWNCTPRTSLHRHLCVIAQTAVMTPFNCLCSTAPDYLARSYAFTILFVSRCFEPSQPLGITSGLETKSNLSGLILWLLDNVWFDDLRAE